jgi:hypothetical protein
MCTRDSILAVPILASWGQALEIADPNSGEDEMRTALSCVAVSMVMWGVPQPAGADPITMRLDRSVSAGASVAVLGHDVENENAQSGADSLFTTTTASSGGATATGSQSLSSALSTDARHFSATGRTSAIAEVPAAGNGTNAGAGGGAIITWDFRLDQAEPFDFHATVTTSGDDVSLRLRTTLGAVFDSHFEPVFEDEDLFTHGGTTSHHGWLEAGRYSFFVQSSSGLFVLDGIHSGSTSFDLNLDLAPVAPTPEPGTMSLIGSGLAAFAVGRRRRRLRA